MKSAQGFISTSMTGLLSGAVLVLAAESAIAAAKVTGVQLSPTKTGVNLVLKTQGSDRPQVFSVNRGNTWTADLVNTRLQLPGGKYQKNNPAAGIASVSVVPLDNNSVRVTVVGQGNSPTGIVNRSSNGDLAFSLSRSKGVATTAAKPAVQPAAKPGPQSTNLSRATQAGTVTPAPSALPALPNTLAQAAPAKPATPATAAKPIAQAAPASPLPPFQNGTPLVPNPTIQVEGKPYTPPPPVPPFAPLPLPRAVAPPVGDMAIGQVDASPNLINLGTTQVVPRLVLRDASAREALSLLARSVGLNLAYVPPKPIGNERVVALGSPGQTPEAEDRTPKITLDIQNEPVQNVFNYILQIADLEANRVGRTIFVSPRLPDTARNVISRTVRLNQASAATASAFLSSLGASTLRSVEVVRIEQIGQPPNQRFVETRDTQIRPLEAQEGTAPLLLRGLTVGVDERLNSVTLVGNPRKVEVASSLLSQLDARRRQVAVNVRVIDVDLIAFERLSTSFSFGVNDSQFVNTGGVAILNFGQQLPSFANLDVPLTPGGSVGPPTTTVGGIPSGFGFTRNFLLQVQAAVTNGSAKILTDPTLVVQEGQQAEVQLGQEVITNIRQQVTASQASTQITVEVEKANAGLTLPVRVDRIDDNGFISLAITPEITRPQSTVNITFTNQGQTVTNPITLLATRRVQSGQVRIRDGQTLLLSGIIQDEDRTTTVKVPILGDIPILGALFRRSETQNQRREVIVLLTPRILDDSDRSAFGYSYTPGPETQRVLQRTNPQR